MPDMVSFDYYVNTYLGTGIPEEQFSKWESRARQVLEKLCREYLVEGGENARAMAVCAMAEELHRSEGKEGVASTSIGGADHGPKGKTEGTCQRRLRRVQRDPGGGVCEKILRLRKDGYDHGKN